MDTGGEKKQDYVDQENSLGSGRERDHWAGEKKKSISECQVV